MKLSPAETIGKLPRRLAALVALVGALAFAPVVQAQVTSLNQSFTGTSAPGWVLGGSGYTPQLTANLPTNPDPVGSGWLRLTSPSTNESTYAYDSTPFASANATITAQFNLAVYNGTGADGITFFLADSSVAFSPGAYGGSLGYAQKTSLGGGGADINGMAGGYLGIGVDEFGNYSNPTEGRIGGTGFVSNAVAVRGPGSGLTGYNYLGGTSSIGTLAYPGQMSRPTGSKAETIQMVLTSTNQLTVSIAYGGTGVFTTIFTADLSGYTRPNDLIMGFTGSTGDNTDIHEIQNVLLTSVSANLWDSSAGDHAWGTASNWVGNPGQVPSVGSDVLLNNADVSTAQTVDLGGASRIIRSLEVDAPFTYTVQNGTLEFNNEGITGTSGIIVTQTNGHTTQTITAGLKADNAMVIENNSFSALNLTGGLNTNGNSVNFNGSGVVTDSGIISGTGSIYQTGAGTTTFSGTNTYSGGTTILAGTLVTNNNKGLGTGTVTLGGGTLSSTTSSTIGNAISLTGDAALSGLTSTGVLTQTGGSYTLNLSGVTQSGKISLSDTTTGQTLTTEVDSGTSTISGIISNGTGAGAGGVTKTGAGTLVLGAVNTYTGATTVNGGTLELNATNAINSASNLTLTNSTLNLNSKSDKVGNLTFTNGTIDFGSTTATNSFVFANATGTGVLSIDNWKSGSTNLAATNATVAGSVLNDIYFAGVGSGAIEAGSLTTVGSEGSAYLITPNTTFLTWNGAAGTSNNTWNKSNWVAGVPSPTAGSVQKLDFAGTTSLAPTMDQAYSANAIKFDSNATSSFAINQNSFVLTLDGNVPSIIDQSTAAQTISGGAITAGVTGTPVNTVVDVVATGKLTISSNISGVGTLTKVDSGTLALSGNNIGYTSPITVQGGILSVSGNNSVLGGTGSTTTIDSGATLQITDGRTLTNALTIGGTGQGGIGALNGAAGAGNTATLSGALTLTGDTTINTSSGTLVLSGGLSGTGDNLTLAGAGNTTISSAIGTGAGATVTLNGTGTTTFSGTNTYTGATTVNSGTLDLSGTKILGDMNVDGGTVVDTASTQLSTTTNLNVNSGTFNLNGFSETVNTLAGNPGGTVALGAGTLDVQGTGSMSYGGAITGTGTLDKENTGKLILSGTSTGFTGNVTLNDGVIDATANNATGTATVAVASSGNFEVQGGISLASAFTLSTNGTSTGNGALENISGNNTVTGAVTVSAASTVQSDAGTLTLSGAVALGANTLTVSGNSNTAITGAITGTSASNITKTGTGTLAIGASNTAFSGTVTVSAGTLQTTVLNAFTNTTAITVNTGAIMSLGNTSQTIGTISDAGTLAFGTSGALTLFSGMSTLSGSITGTGTLTLDSGSTLTLGASFNDPNLTIILAGGTLKLNGTNDTFGNLSVTGSSIIDFGSGSNSDLVVNDVGVSAGQTLSVQNWTYGSDYLYSSTSPGAQGAAPLDQIVFSSFPGAITHWDSGTTGPDASHQISPVPEPATYGAIFVGISLAAIMIQRRRRSRA